MRLVFDGKRAAGIDYVHKGKNITPHAEREIILCGGVVNSPQLIDAVGNRRP